MLRAQIATAGSQIAWCAARAAEGTPVGTNAVSRFLKGFGGPPPKLLGAMGLRAVVTYEAISTENETP